MKDFRRLAQFLIRSATCVTILVGSMLALSDTRPPVNGDGPEYVAMSRAFLRHGTPNITTKDAESVSSWPANKGTGLENATAALIDRSPPCFTSFNGERYSYHFWLYSLINAPAMALTRVAGFADTYSFVLTNLTLAWAACFVIFKSRRMDSAGKAAAMGLFWISGPIYYINWPHPEVLTCAAIATAVVLMLDGVFLAAGFIAAAAAQQNPPVGLIAIGALALYFWQRTRGNPLRLRPYPDIAGGLLCGALLLLAPVFWKLRFGNWNLIAAKGGSDPTLVSPSRLFSFYFDLNQGVVVMLPWVILALLAGLVLALKNKAVRFASIPLALIALSILLSLPCLSAPNWNCGCNIVSRYATWTAIPLIFAVLMLIRSDKWRATLLVAQAATAFAWLYPLKYNYINHNFVASYFLNRHPDCYDPIPEIFVERGLSHEVSRDRLASDRLLAYGYFAKGSLVKIYTTKPVSTTEELLPGIPAAGLTPIPAGAGFYYHTRIECGMPDGLRSLPPSSVPLSESKPIFIGTREGSAPDESAFFGFAGMETEGIWSVSKTCSVFIALPPSVTEGVLEIDATALVPTAGFHQPVTVDFLDAHVTETLDAKANRKYIRVPFHRPDVKKPTVIRMTTGSLVRPKDFDKHSPDTRSLGLYIRAISLASEFGFKNQETYPSGWSADERTHMWSNGRTSIIRFATPAAKSRLVIQGMSHGKQRVIATLNGHRVLEGEITSGTLTIPLNGHTVAGKRNELVLEWPDAAFPGNGDNRMIAFAVHSMSFE